MADTNDGGQGRRGAGRGGAVRHGHGRAARNGWTGRQVGFLKRVSQVRVLSGVPGQGSRWVQWVPFAVRSAVATGGCSWSR